MKRIKSSHGKCTSEKYSGNLVVVLLGQQTWGKMKLKIALKQTQNLELSCLCENRLHGKVKDIKNYVLFYRCLEIRNNYL